jgi:hypothetical protein
MEGTGYLARVAHSGSGSPLPSHFFFKSWTILRSIGPFRKRFAIFLRGFPDSGPSQPQAVIEPIKLASARRHGEDTMALGARST